MNASELVEAINTAEGTAYRYRGTLSRGHQGGAHLISDGTRDAVLKLGQGGWLRQIERVAPLLDDARRHGYPAPNFLQWGEVGMRQYLIYAFVPGESLPGVTPKTLPFVLDLSELQAHLRPDTEQDWSKYAYNVVFNNESGWSETLRNHGGVARHFMEEVDKFCKEFAGHKLPADDLVHGDFGWENILWDGREVTGVIDMEYAGKGTRAIDLACLMEHVDVVDPAWEVLMKKVRSIVGKPGLAIVFCYRAMAMVEWFFRQSQPEVAEARAIRALRVLEVLGES